MGYLGQLLDTMNQTLKGLIRVCPYQGKFRITNATFFVNMSDPNDKWARANPSNVPNGNYKLRILAFNKNDDNIATFTIFWDINYRQLSLASNDKF